MSVIFHRAEVSVEAEEEDFGVDFVLAHPLETGDHLMPGLEAVVPFLLTELSDQVGHAVVITA